MLEVIAPHIEGLEQALTFDELLGITKIPPKDLFELLHLVERVNINGTTKYYIPRREKDFSESEKILRINSGAVKRYASSRRLNHHLATENAYLRSVAGLRVPDQRVKVDAGEFLILLLSDWHVEERITYDCTGGQNEVTPEIIERRVGVLCSALQNELKPYRGMPLVIWLGGDFINGSIHQEYNEIGGNFLVPEEARRFAMQLISKVIVSLRELCEIYVICSYGNHGRINQGTPRSQSGALYNHEYFMYLYLADMFPDVPFQVTQSYCAYLDLLNNCSVRFTHGDAVRKGGIGGWIKSQDAIYTKETKRICLLTCMGHYHSLQVGNGYLINSALVGGNLYSRSNGYEPEPPQQVLALFSGQELAWIKRVYCEERRWN